MDIKYIIREEIDNFGWVSNTQPFLDKKWIILNDISKEDPYMETIQKTLFGFGWKHDRNFNKQRVIPVDKFESKQVFGDGIMAYIKSNDMDSKTFEFFVNDWEINLSPKHTSLKIYYASDINKGFLTESDEDGDDFDWIRSVSGELPEINDQNKYLALVELLGVEEVFGDVTGFDDPDTEFEQNSWSHYGIDTFTLNNGEVWVVGKPEEFDSALHDYWLNFPDDVGLYTVHDFQNYLIMSDLDRRLYAQDMSYNYIIDLSDDEVIDLSQYQDEFDELEEKISELEDRGDGIDTSIDDEISELEEQKENLINRAREEVGDDYYNEWYECLEDPYECFVRLHGFYSNAQELCDSGAVFFDKNTFADDMVYQTDWGELNGWDGSYEESSGYVLMRIE